MWVAGVVLPPSRNDADGLSLRQTNLAEAGSLILENHIRRYVERHFFSASGFNLSRSGSFTSEWYYISKYTKNDTYRILADTAMKEIMRSDPRCA